MLHHYERHRLVACQCFFGEFSESIYFRFLNFAFQLCVDDYDVGFSGADGGKTELLGGWVSFRCDGHFWRLAYVWRLRRIDWRMNWLMDMSFLVAVSRTSSWVLRSVRWRHWKSYLVGWLRTAVFFCNFHFPYFLVDANDCLDHTYIFDWFELLATDDAR